METGGEGQGSSSPPPGEDWDRSRCVASSATGEEAGAGVHLGMDDLVELLGMEDNDAEATDSVGPLRELELEARMECLKAKATHPEMFVSGFDADDQGEGIEDAEDPDSPGERLLSASEEGDLVLIKELISGDPSLLGYQDKDGYTALHRAAYSDHCSIIRFLVGEGASVEIGTEDGWTSLHSACHWNSFKAVKELVSCGANVNAQTNGGQTPLMIASNQVSHECMIILLTHPKIDISLKNKLGDTALDLAKRAGRLSHLFEMCQNQNTETKSK